jgi:hypothetical protein
MNHKKVADGLFFLEARIVGRNASSLLEDDHIGIPESLQEVRRSVLHEASSYIQAILITLMD